MAPASAGVVSDDLSCVVLAQARVPSIHNTRQIVVSDDLSCVVYTRNPRLSKNNTRQIVRNYAGRSRRHELLGHSRSSCARDCSLCKFTSALQGSALSEA